MDTYAGNTQVYIAYIDINSNHDDEFKIMLISRGGNDTWDFSCTENSFYTGNELLWYFLIILYAFCSN